MCLAAFSFGTSHPYAMVFAANRDERHARPTAPADWWQDHPSVLGGRDLLAGGTWLAVDQRGRLAAVTNVPTTEGKRFQRSRGELVVDFLVGDVPATEFLLQLRENRGEFGPYNLLLFDADGMHYFSNGGDARHLAPGAYALSNAPLGTPWPKVTYAQSVVASVAGGDPVDRLFQMLESRDPHGSEPGVDRRQSRVFIEDGEFGTRSSTVVLVSRTGEVRFVERRHHADGTRAGESEHRFKRSSASALEASR